MKKHIHYAVILSSLTFTALIITFAIMIAINGCTSTPVQQEQQIFHYELKEGENGVTMFTINSDSTITTEYILNGKCFRLDSILPKVYEDTMKTIYNTKQ